MKKSKSRKEIFEEELRPVIEDQDIDPFRSRDIEKYSSYDSSQIGRCLTRIAKNEDKVLERIHINPGVYTLEGNDLSDYEGILEKGEGRKEILANSLISLLEESDKTEFSDTEFMSILSDKVDEFYDLTNIPAKHRKIGELKEELRETEELSYYPTEDVYRIEE